VTTVWAEKPGNRGSIPGRGKRFSIIYVLKGALGHTQPPVQRASVVFSAGTKRLGSETNHFLPSGVSVKNGRYCTWTVA
jgi:hypothetical protein